MWHWCASELEVRASAFVSFRWRSLVSYQSVVFVAAVDRHSTVLGLK
jgi:hypothetical protein